MSETPVGRQILMLTQAERIEHHPVSCLDSALALLATHRRLCGGAEFPTGRVHGGAN
jgi:hypothetical protein